MNASSIGIIGGADGPTAIFVTGSPVGTILMMLSAAVVIGLGIWFFVRRK